MSKIKNGVKSWFKKEKYQKGRLGLVEFYINLENRIINPYLKKEDSQDFIQLVKSCKDTKILTDYYNNKSNLINKIHIPTSHERSLCKLDNSFKFNSFFKPNKDYSGLSSNGVYTMDYDNLKNQVEITENYISNHYCPVNKKGFE